MRKLSVAGVAVVLLGFFIADARATVTLGGDARVRYVYKDAYDFGNSSQDATTYFDSRVRVKVEAKAAGGAFMKARVRFDDLKWDGQGWNAYREDKNIWVDYGWIGVPMGPVTVEAGRMIANFSRFFSWDNRPSRVKATWKGGGLKLVVLYDIKDEFVNANDDLADNDFRVGGLVASYRMNEDWLLKGYLRYQWDDREWTEAGGSPGGEELVNRSGDNSGALGSIHLQGRLAGFGLTTEVAWKAADVVSPGKEDDAWGWYLNLDYPWQGLTPSLNIGVTRDGYLADNDFGWIMLGNTQENPTAVISQVGTSGDWFWIAPSLKWAASDRLTLGANFVWVNVDAPAEAPVDDRRLAKLYELSGSLRYAISEGADFTLKVGYLQPDFDGRLDGVGIQDDGAVGGYARLQIKF